MRGDRERLRIIALLGVLFLVCMGAFAADRSDAASPHVLFVCEHGNVKSLMAAEYFARRATERGLALGAVARGTAPNSLGVPPPIVEGLRAEGFDVAAFVPRQVAPSDAVDAVRVVVIGVVLPEDVARAARGVEIWNDVPPASEDFAAARQALGRHVEDLLRRLASPPPER